jgi:alkanesulfonate monooxygenase SsuD/methylene tetrahydromethanopterin reductase-like flavin-dependent oxidoreductase (luciferase family)
LLPAGVEAELAALAESHGLFGVLAGKAAPLSAVTAAVYASTATRHVRIGVWIQLGLDHPVTIAEELSILDNVNNGRTFAVVNTGELDVDEAEDELAVIREALASLPLRHEGPHWHAPAGIAANATAPRAISVTPKPAQLEIAFWVCGAAAAELSSRSGVPLIALAPKADHAGRLVQPALDELSGELDKDRVKVTAWAEAGVSHLLVGLPPGRESELMTMVSRHLVPEVGMPHFPRVMSESSVPLAWPPHDVDRREARH